MNNYNVVYSEDYLAHHGILGQKWGVRRFQNSDGSLTSAGKKRYNTIGKPMDGDGFTSNPKPHTIGKPMDGDGFTAKQPKLPYGVKSENNIKILDAKADVYKKIYDAAVKVRDSSKDEKIEALDKGVKKADKAIKAANKINDSLPAKKAPKEDASKMTDEELRKKVNRMQLEQQYNQLSDREVSRGSDIAREILQSAGSIVGTVGTAVGIYMAFTGKGVN